ncbi:SCA7-domain-containing protein [Cristinia sonorae]|uniref:SCA7-domain-containing protein n=1 Tax=Cristinia sonorae TaxID=1940300 RepID=A0A8K0XSM5_9AGAR|nr:SCA7-domain-containing protein [Cristinia sonorae]
MPVKLKPSPSASPQPFSWDNVPSPSPPPNRTTEIMPPTQWLSALDMKTFGAEPLKYEIGIMKCKECGKPVLQSAVSEHADNCNKIRAGGKKGAKGKPAVPIAAADSSIGKKRKAEDEDPTPEDPSAPKKKKPATKVTKGRMKGPVDYDKQCGVINDKGLPCSRSLTCKSHSMGAKRAVQGRSRNYDELLLEWNRLNNPNFVEPVKRESKQERKERKEKEKAEKKKQQMEAAAAAGADVAKKPAAAAGAAPKKAKKAAAASSTAVAAAVPGAGPIVAKADEDESFEDVDSEVEMDALIGAVRVAQDRGLIGVPLAVPCDASSWFVGRRERVRTCRELLANALMPSRRLTSFDESTTSRIKLGS